MTSITLKVAAGTLASLAAMGMTGGAAFALPFSETEGYRSHANVVAEQPIGEAVDEAVDSGRERQQQAGHMVKHPQSVTYKITGRVDGTRAAAVNVAREAQRQAVEVLGN